MSRHSSSGSTDHSIRSMAGQPCFHADDFEISWVVDFYYEGTRGRFPRRFRRLTNRRGAERFAKKWKLAMPALGKRSPW